MVFIILLYAKVHIFFSKSYCVLGVVIGKYNNYYYNRLISETSV